MTLKRLASPAFWKIERKTKKYIVTPLAGPFSKEKCIPLGVIIRDMLKLAENKKEVKNILNNSHVKVNNVIIKKYNFPVGVMDILSFDNNSYILFPSVYGISLFKTETNPKKLLLIKNKKTLPKNKIQLNFHNGTNLITEKNYKTHDVIVFDVFQNNISDLLEFKKGACAVIVSGKNKGKIGTVKEIGTGYKPNVVMDVNGADILVPKDYIFVIGKKEPFIKIGERV